MPAEHPNGPWRPRVLIVDDDRAMLRATHAILSNHAYRVMEASDGRTGIHLATTEQPDLVILDVGLPDLTGTELCDRLRQAHFPAPILMVTGRQEIEDRVRGLESGADDYLPKPYDERELLARVAALLRRSRRPGQRLRSADCGPIHLDFEQRTVTKAGMPLRVTKTELALLELLARHHGRPLTRKTILDAVWGYARTPDTRTVDTHVWRLRKKIGDSGDDPQWLKLVAGQGYCLDNCVINPDGGHD